jgi:pre-mRNA-processing factor 8
MGVKFDARRQYGLKLGNPKEFYHESHRPTHFLELASMDPQEATLADAEVPDHFA